MVFKFLIFREMSCQSGFFLPVFATIVSCGCILREGFAMERGSRVVVYIEGWDDPITATVEDDQRDYLKLKELDLPVAKSTIITCNVISDEDIAAEEVEQVSKPVIGSVRESIPVLEDDGKKKGPHVARTVAVLALTALLVAFAAYLFLA